MLDESSRQAYLEAMGVTQWQLRSLEDDETVELIESDGKTEQPKTELNLDVQQSTAKLNEIRNVEVSSPKNENVLPAEPDKTYVPGLKWLNKSSRNGLLIILPEASKHLSSESRLLLSKMLKGIHFLPSESGFALTLDLTNHAKGDDFRAVSLDNIKAILVLGSEASKLLAAQSQLDTVKVVSTYHPDEMLIKPELKAEAWQDLKKLVQLFNQS